MFLKGQHDQLKKYKDTADYFFCANLPNTGQTSVDRTSGGFLYIRSGANTQYSTGASFLAVVYADYLNGTSVSCRATSLSSTSLVNFAQRQANYILGVNPPGMSYMVGYGRSFPQQPHHRGASIQSIAQYRNRVGCGEGFNTWYSLNAPNPNELIGGPDKDDSFVDARSNSAQLEPTTYINAPFVGLLARLTRE